MTRTNEIKHEFVAAIPQTLAENTIYIAMEYATAVHRCVCGCGNEVITPLSPTDWILQYDGVTISISPSIGNWNFPCRSHYWIRQSKVRWAEQWSEGRVAVGRAYDRSTKNEYFTGNSKAKPLGHRNPRLAKNDRGFWFWVSRWWSH